MKITSALFETFLKCPTKCYLRSLGETGSGNEYAAWVRTQDEAYEREAGRRLQETVSDCERVASLPADETFKTAKWRLAMNVEAQTPDRSADSHGGESQGNEAAGQLGDAPPQPGSSGREFAPSVSRDSQSRLTSAATNLESRLHAIERIPSEGRGKAAQFIPIRFIWRNKLTKDDKLLLAFDAFVLGQALGREIARGKIIHGDLRNCIRSCRGNEAQTQNPQLSSPNPQQIDQSLLTSATSQADARERMDERQAAQTPTALSQARLQSQVLKVKTSALFGEVRKRIEKIATLLSTTRSADSHVRASQTNQETRGLSDPRSGPAPPDLVLNRHCAECEFRDRCRKIAMEKDDLSLLAGMSAKERQKLRSKGIFTVTQLSYTFRPRRRPKRLRDKREKYHHALKALAIREQKIHIVGSPELKIEGTPVYLDVEGLPDRDFYYLIGLRIGHGDSAVQHSLWADTVADEGKIWREFLAILETIEKPVLIHYGSYETTFLRQMGQNYGGPMEGSVVAKAIESAFNPISVFFARIYFPTFANGLKDIAAFLGFKWSEAEPAGLKSIMWRFAWEESKSAHIREKLITYNAEDCQALEILTRAAQTLGALGTADNPTETWQASAVHAESIQRKMPWRKFTSSIGEFEAINKAAQWDYQRDRVHVRGNSRKRIRRRPGRPKNSEQSLDRVNKVIAYEAESRCPHCREIARRQIVTRSRIVRDIKFGAGGLKRWIVEYRFCYCWCGKCKLRFGGPPDLRIGMKYGWNFIAYFLYETIELRIPQSVVQKSVERLFGFQVNLGTIAEFKARATGYYKETQRLILESIARGGLAHVDETRANIKGKIGYVWIFTNLHEVAYLYSDSREGEIAHTTLSGFTGVLVSDFYSAYDSFACPQQKCLIHLMRDLNDEMLDRPFDEELRQIVTGFASVLTPMVETVDRYGLKKHFLKKHRKSVERFYRQIEKADFQSEAAITCKERFEKNRDKLFTFLEHDGVPWNNNNAEHAVKAFALLRDVLRGSSTRKGLEDYLVLLSVCQTCKYMGVDFLDFLRSGEQDIHAFAESRSGHRRRTQTRPVR
ncbi:MAG: IS66 family transposase [Verrucomicrobia bacterium]|nr:IS66 family transposase [Verrucomicrobiota bacterium]